MMKMRKSEKPKEENPPQNYKKVTELAN